MPQSFNTSKRPALIINGSVLGSNAGFASGGFRAAPMPRRRLDDDAIMRDCAVIQNRLGSEEAMAYLESALNARGHR